MSAHDPERTSAVVYNGGCIRYGFNREKPEIPKAAWQTCKICRDLPSLCTADRIAGESLPPAVGKLEGCANLLRCPLCHTFYDFDDGNDPHHYMRDKQMVTRIDTGDRVRRRHVAYASNPHAYPPSAEKAKRWLQVLDADMAD